MPKEIQSKNFLVNAMKAFLTMCAVAVCFICMSASQKVIGMEWQPSYVGVQDFGCELPKGAVNYYDVVCFNKTTEVKDTVMLKVVKINDGLVVYEAREPNVYSDTESENFSAKESSSQSSSQWEIALTESSDYSYLISVTPVCPIIRGEKVWDCKKDEAYVDVAGETVVKFDLKINNMGDSSEPGVSFWVKKVVSDEQASLLVTTPDTDGNPNWDGASDKCLVPTTSDENGKAIVVELIPATAAKPEIWRVTVTGYVRLSPYDYYEVYETAVESPDGQRWVKGSKKMLQHVAYNPVSTGDVEYVLSVAGRREGLAAEADADSYEIFKVTKTLTDGEVTEVTVEGLTGLLDPSSVSSKSNPTVTFATVTGAKFGEKSKSPDEGKIVFDDSEDSTIALKLSDIKDSDGVDVYFQIGQGNGEARLNLTLRMNGELYCKYFRMPRDEYVVNDEEGTKYTISICHDEGQISYQIKSRVSEEVSAAI